MSDKKKHSDYKNIDFDTDFFEEIKVDTKNNLKEQHTLDFYNDEMPKKAVKGIFNINNEPIENTEKKENKKTYGYDGTDRHNTLKKSTENKVNTNNDNIEYTHQSFDYDKLNNAADKGYVYGGSKTTNYDYKNTSFSQEKILAERKAREEVEKNKEILKELARETSVTEKVKSINPYKTVQEIQESMNTIPKKRTNNQISAKKRQIIIFRLCTTSFIIIILISLCINIYSKSKLKNEIVELKKQNELLTEENLQVQLLDGQIQILEGEISKLRSQIGSTENTEQNQNTDGTVDSGTGETTGEIYHTVQSGESLSTISNKYYGDPNKYNLIYDANNLTTANVVVGQKLLIP